MKMVNLKNLCALFVFFMAFFQSSNAAYNVVSYGARPDGQTDSTQAFQRAWTATCSSRLPATFYVPGGKFLIRSVVFGGPCMNRILVQIDGTLVAPSNYWNLGNSGFWILFIQVTRLTVYGGTIDARGAAFWACKNARSSCPIAARSISFVASDNILISGLTSIDSQTMNVALDGCNNVRIRNMKIIASGQSPNTDGIHLQSSTGVTITNCIIKTRDECISIGPGNKNLWIERIACGPGHGIRIGSLGNSLIEDGVNNVTVTNSIFTGTQNGVWIKTWGRPSNGFATNIAFRNIIMRQVGNPIVIDQKYCPYNQCPTQVRLLSSILPTSNLHYTAREETRHFKSIQHGLARLPHRPFSLSVFEWKLQFNCVHISSPPSLPVRMTRCPATINGLPKSHMSPPFSGEACHRQYLTPPSNLNLQIWSAASRTHNNSGHNSGSPPPPH